MQLISFFQHGKRDRATVIFNSSLGGIFGVKKYAEALTKVIKEKDIQANFSHELIEVKPDTKEAIFRLLNQPEGATKTYRVLLQFYRIFKEFSSHSLTLIIIFSDRRYSYKPLNIL